MVSLIVIILCILILVALKLIKTSLKLTQSASGLVLGGSAKITKTAKPVSGIFSVGKKTSDIAFGAARKVIGGAEFCIKSIAALFAPLALIEFIASVMVIVVVMMGSGAYLTQLSENAKFTKTTTIAQAKESNSKPPEGTAGGYGSTANPGIQDEEWNKTSDYGKKVVNTAIAWMQTDPLTYSQSPGAGQWDCSSFVGAVINIATGHKFDGTKIEGVDLKDLFDRRTKINKFSMPEQVWTGSAGNSDPSAMLNKIPQGSKGFIASVNSNWEKNALPGDVFLCDGHVKFYLGHRKSDGKAMWAESMSPGTPAYKDLATTQPRSDMGIVQKNVSGVGFEGDQRPYYIIRPYVLMK